MRSDLRDPRGAVAVARAPLGSDATRSLGIVLLAAAAGAALALAVISTGGGFLVALLSYSFGASLFAALGVGLLLLRETGLGGLRPVWPRRARRLRRFAS
jgi:hypothetical protein